MGLTSGTLIGHTAVPHARDSFLFWHGHDGLQAIRVGDYKLFFDGKNAKIKTDKGAPALFNIVNDGKEKINLSQQFPEKVQAMQERAQQYLRDIEHNTIPLGFVEEP